MGLVGFSLRSFVYFPLEHEILERKLRDLPGPIRGKVVKGGGEGYLSMVQTDTYFLYSLVLNGVLPILHETSLLFTFRAYIFAHCVAPCCRLANHVLAATYG